MSLEELARMKAADETFRKNQELKAENQRKALAAVTKDNIDMVNTNHCFVSDILLWLSDKQTSRRRKTSKRS